MYVQRKYCCNERVTSHLKGKRRMKTRPEMGWIQLQFSPRCLQYIPSDTRMFLSFSGAFSTRTTPTTILLISFPNGGCSEAERKQNELVLPFLVSARPSMLVFKHCTLLFARSQCQAKFVPVNKTALLLQDLNKEESRA